jgi:hypothetical protein
LAVVFLAHAIFALFLVVFSGFASLLARRTRSAVTAGVCVVFVVVGLLPTVTQAYARARTGRGAEVPPIVELALNPAAYHNAILAPERVGSISASEWDFTAKFVLGLLLFAAIYGGTSLVLLGLMLTRLRALGRRYLG